MCTISTAKLLQISDMTMIPVVNHYKKAMI